MTRFFYDTEFVEDGRTIDLVSIGIAAEDALDDARHVRAMWRHLALEVAG